MSSGQGEHEARIHREQVFHDARFTEESRQRQHKFYFALESGIADFRARIEALADDADCLEYGCGPTPVSLELSARPSSLNGIDISPVAVAAATERSVDAGKTGWRFSTMDGERMTFGSESFDVVYGSGIVHHLDVAAAGAEVGRVLRPGGRALFWEPLGENPLWAAYRRRTPNARTEDEHPLRRDHIEALARPFSRIDVSYYGLSTLASVPLRSTRLGKPARTAFETLDRVLFRSERVARNAWFAALEVTK